MITIYTVLLLMFFFLTTYLFNRSKMEDEHKIIILVSFVEALVCYLFVFTFFLQGFFPRFLFFFLFLILLITITTILFFIQKELDNDPDWQIETIKNSLTLFFLTIFPLFIFLTIFRFQSPFLQILYSILAISLLWGLHLFLVRLSAPILAWINTFFSDLYAIKYIILWVIIGLITSSIILFDLPKDHIKYQMNLSDHTPYFNFHRFPTNLDNNYRSKTIMTLNTNAILSDIYDVYYDDTNIYIYTIDHTYYVFDQTTETLLYQRHLTDPFINDDQLSHTYRLKNWFLESEDSIFLLAGDGLYKADNDSLVLITDALDIRNADPYTIDSNTYFLNHVNSTQYHIYSLTNGTTTVDETIDTDTSPYDDLTVISKHLFYKQNDLIYLKDDPTVIFTSKFGTPFYDASQETLYYIQTPEYATDGSLRVGTKIHKVTSELDITTLFINNASDTLTGISIEDTAYLIDFNPNSLETFDILAEDLCVTAIHNPIKTQPFWFNDKIQKRYIASIKQTNNTLEYVQVERNFQNTILTITHLESGSTGLNLPFYSHYSLWMFTPVIIALCIPLTDYRKYLTILSFEKLTKKRN